ncbi:LamG domain-containing protein [Sphaerotilus sp.]|uniref:LamG domain-containing protein n=1 Tax=Sphaerotilus sp. TaxID=2093942 RepID=UPI002ACECA26|nr:LamG domain-containing protein [Sphaerotilus sp.]MDZ7858198.1 LamG domain-containing protein [Sphaerotilus sp.]
MAGLLWRLLRQRSWPLWWLCLLPGLVHAGTYAPRSDTYAWESTANAVTWSRACTDYPVDDDQMTISFTGGFRFRLAGTNYTSVRILSNGMLQFGTDNGLFRIFTNTTLPAGAVAARTGCTSGATANTLMAYWTDLNPAEGGTVTWEQKGTAPNRYFVVSWNDVFQYNTSTPYTFQIILYENGEFKYQYANDNATGSNATIGVQISSTDYTLYAYNTGYNSSGSAIRWYIPSTLPYLVADFRFDESSWAGLVGEVKDSTGNSNHGVRVGAASNTASGKICRALSVPANTGATIDGVDSSVQVSSVLGSKGTLSFWYAGNTTWAGTTGVLMDATTRANRPFHLSVQAGVLKFMVSDSAGNILTASSPAQTVAANTWTHITAIWSLTGVAAQSTLTLLVNGSQVATVSGTTNGLIDASIGTLMLGDNRSAVTSTGGTLNSANGRLDEVRLYNYALTPVQALADVNQTHACPTSLDHLELRHASGTGVTCAPSTLTVVACQDASCSTPYTGGVSATLSASASAGVVWPDGMVVNIASGSSAADVRVQYTTAGSTVLSATASAPTASRATSCNFGSPACTYTASASGLLLSAPNHLAESSGNLLTVRAVRASDNSNQCVPAFTGTKSIRLQYAYQNPATGTAPVRIGGTALSPGGSDTALTFDATGTATAALAYADVGQVQLTGTYTGSAASNDTGLSMTGSTSFIAAPASFEFTSVPTGTTKAGNAFSATLRARNSAGNTTPNFGRESPAQTPTLSHIKAAPTGTGSSSGTFTGSLGAFSSGSATASSLVWSEVGRLDLKADLASYLGTGTAVTGTTGSAGTALGRFIPHHFDVSATPACGSFSYAGQPFTISVIAMNGLSTPTRTVNYDGSGALSPAFAQSVTLSDAAGLALGSFGSTATLAASRFSAGVGSTTSLAYTYTDKLGAPGSLTLRATDADSVSSSGYLEPAMPLRSGRLWLSNVFGSEKAALQLPVQAQYWTGRAWVLNSADSCTSVLATAVVPSGYLNYKGSATASWTTTPGALTILGGNGTISLSAPSPAGSTGSVDLALNLGSTTTDASCLASHPASTGAGLPWLRGRNGSCASTWDRDPSARASFGIATPETRKTVHVRELY